MRPPIQGTGDHAGFCLCMGNRQPFVGARINFFNATLDRSLPSLQPCFFLPLSGVLRKPTKGPCCPHDRKRNSFALGICSSQFPRPNRGESMQKVGLPDKSKGQQGPRFCFKVPQLVVSTCFARESQPGESADELRVSALRLGGLRLSAWRALVRAHLPH